MNGPSDKCSGSLFVFYNGAVTPIMWPLRSGHGTLRHNINSGQAEAQAAAFSRQRLPCGHCHGHLGPGAQSWGGLPPDIMCVFILWPALEAWEMKDCWESHSKEARTHCSCFTESSACVSRKAVTAAVRSKDRDTNDTNTERKAESRSGCDAWSQRLGLGVLDVTSHVCDSLVSSSEWLWLLMSVWWRIQFAAACSAALQNWLQALTQPVSAQWLKVFSLGVNCHNFVEIKSLRQALSWHLTVHPGPGSTLGLKDRIFDRSQLPVLVSIQSVFVRRVRAKSWSHSF